MTGFTLEQIASFAEIFGALTIVTGIIFAWFQIRMYRTLQRDRMALRGAEWFEWLALLARKHNADQDPAYARAAGWRP